ncbi:DedA family protein [Xylophilus sp. GOD-11R]|uniref:DedA family protein n=1 Tax=Xylophilus sp. GOD-11R TaxID=3089814 RepID=UPI00298D1F65|nr:DedA family protein [Xylophilus sp. GOD-11R]WPB57874.1 DedA family protein [Xylophilus sp. GOD-11R]
MFHIHTAHLLADYGYYAVFFAGLLEGETILLLGAYAVHQGYLHMLPLIACGAAAAFCSDQFYFQLGRRKGAQVLQRHPKLQKRFAKATAFVDRHPIATVMLMRFAWGLRIVFPVTLGMTRMRTALYVPLSALASVIWAATVAYLGVWVTGVLKTVIGNLHHYELTIIGMAALIGLVVAFRHVRMS